MIQQKSSNIKLLTDYTPNNSFDAFPFGLYECTPAAEIAMYYGFTSVHRLKPSDIDPEANQIVDSLNSVFPCHESDQKLFNTKEKATLIKMYREGRFPSLPNPIMLYYEKPLTQQKSKSTYKHSCSIDIIGVEKSISEALVIQSSLAILEDAGFSNLEVEINNTGDDESRNRYESELKLYIKTSLGLMPDNMKDACRTDPYMLFSFNNTLAEKLQNNAPEPIAYLSDKNRKHFTEILEYLEGLGIAYSIKNNLLANRKVQSQTIFRIISKDLPSTNREIISARGMRYSALGRSLGFRKEIPAMGVYLSYIAPLSNRKKSLTKRINPNFCFVHLGFDARLKSLKIINDLRKKRIPLCHCLTREKLTPQMSFAGKLNLPYMIIIGQKEAAEGTVIVRSIENRSQETIPLTKLYDHLRKLKRRKTRVIV